MGAGKRFSGQLKAGADPGPIVIAALTAATSFANEAGLNERSGARLAVVVEELVSNAVRHGAGGNAVCLSLTLDSGPLGVEIDLEDDGAAFDPTVERAFSGPDEDSGGGVGLELVRAWCDSFDYERVDGRNCVSLKMPKIV